MKIQTSIRLAFFGYLCDYNKYFPFFIFIAFYPLHTPHCWCQNNVDSGLKKA